MRNKTRTELLTGNCYSIELFHEFDTLTVKAVVPKSGLVQSSDSVKLTMLDVVRV